MPFININETRIYYNDMGQGEPAILYLSGLCDSRNSFNQFTFSCAKNRRVIALDWRGHGKSDKAKSDFGFQELVEDALTLIEKSKINYFTTVSKANGGWVAIELKRLLPHKIQSMIFIDWQLFEPSIQFMDLIISLQKPDEYQKAREILFNMWLEDVDNPEVTRLVKNEMASYDFEMWSRAARAIEDSYEKHGSPIKLLSEMEPHVPVLHLYSQPEEHGYLISQENFSASNNWFNVRKLNLRSHFLTIEVPELAASIIEQFIMSNQLKATGT